MTSNDAPRTKGVLGKVLDRLPGFGREPARAVARDEPEIQEWIVAQVARALDLEVEAVDVQVPFAEYGLDSRTAVGLSGELEDWLGLELSPTLVWDYPTIESMARFLAAESAAKFDG